MAIFEWDEDKNISNFEKHKVRFYDAIKAFDDKNRVVFPDIKHSETENRMICLGAVNGVVMTVRFTMRGEVIRIFGAAYWRKGKKDYEQANAN